MVRSILPERAENEPTAAVEPERFPAAGYAVRLYPLDEPGELQLIDLWRVVWSGKWVIVVAAAAGVLATFLAALVMTPVYRAEVVMSPVSADNAPGGGLSSLASQFGGLAALAGISVGLGQDDTAQALAILKSRKFTEAFIDRHQLLPILYADLWDPKTRTWDVEAPGEAPTRSKAYDLFDRSIRVITQDPETGLVTLSIDWSDAAQATEWANGLVNEVNANVRGRAIEQSNRNIDFLRSQLQSTNEVELRAAVFGVMEAEMKNAMLANVKAEYAFEVIDPAVVPEKRLWPNRFLLAVFGFGAGALLGTLFVFLHRLVRTAPRPND
jgi:uncharacterized protein involved in exopolysaccharide biosynthesis